MSSVPDPNLTSAGQTALPRSDFEGNLAAFQSEFIDFVQETDPTFDLNILRHTPFVAAPPPAAPPATAPLYPTRKEELNQPMVLSGPRLVEGDIFADEVWLKNDLRVKGSIFGRKSVRIGPGCVIEGGVVSDGLLEVAAGSRIEGSLVGAEIQLSGPVQVVGFIYSRSGLISHGRLAAQGLYAGSVISLDGSPGDEVALEAGLIMAKAGTIKTNIPVWLAGVRAQPETHSFVLTRSAAGSIILLPAKSLSEATQQTTIMTSLTDIELERLIGEVDRLEIDNTSPPDLPV